MPALHVFSTRWEASTDSFALYALLLLVYHVIWLFMYWIGLVAFTAPSKCPFGAADSQQYVFTYLLLFFYIMWTVLAAALLLVSVRGAPLEVSKRRLLVPLIYVYFLSWIPGFGALAYAVYVLYGVENTCWASGSKGMIKLMTFGAMGILAGIAFTLLTTHILFGEVRPGVTWHALKKGITTCAGVYGWLLLKDRGPLLNLEELATEYLDQHCNSLDLDKSDVVMALLCARLVQRERSETLAKKRLRAAGYPVPEESGTRESASKKHPLPNKQQVRIPEGAAEVSPAATRNPQDSEAVRIDSHQILGSAGGSGVNGSKDRAAVVEWVRRVCQGQGVALTPFTAAVQHLAPTVGVAQAAALCTDAEGVVDEATLSDAQRWARFAAAAYGSQGYLWTVQGGLAGGRHLAKLARHAKREAKLPGGCSSKLAAEVVAIRELLGVSEEDIVHYSPADESTGRLAYFIALDRQQHAVVLSVSGEQRYTLMAPNPTQLPSDWVPRELKGAGPHAVHAGALAAAQNLLADLDSHGALRSVLPTPAGPVSHCCTQAPGQQQMRTEDIAAEEAGAQADTPAGGDPAAAAHVNAGAGAGAHPPWSLVLTGHGQGAGAAVLLGVRLQQQHPGLRMWAFGPPGGLCSPSLSHHLQLTTFSVILGKDVTPRASSDTLGRLIEEGLAGLARLRYNKGLVLVALLAEKAGPRSWRGRWLNPASALHAPENIPEESAQLLGRFLQAQLAARPGQQRSREDAAHGTGLSATQPPSAPCTAGGAAPEDDSCTQLAGRVIYLRRMRAPPPQQQGVGDVEAQHVQGTGREGAGCKTDNSQQGPGCCGGCCGGCIPLGSSLCSAQPRRESTKIWDAVWVSPKAVKEEGIVVSKRSLHDHYVSRLLNVLQRLQA